MTHGIGCVCPRCDLAWDARKQAVHENLDEWMKGALRDRAAEGLRKLYPDGRCKSGRHVMTPGNTDWRHDMEKDWAYASCRACKADGYGKKPQDSTGDEA